jgi:hypothetical protein
MKNALVVPLYLLAAAFLSAADAPSHDDRPLSKSYILVDAFGFLGDGPSVEYGIALSPSTQIGLNVRLEGFGLIHQAVSTQGFTNTGDPLSFGVEAAYYILLPSRGMNRFFLEAFVGYGWGGTSGGIGIDAWKNNYSGIEAGVGGGYRWRFPAGFYLEAGAAAEVWYGLNDSWYYTNDPATVYKNEPAIDFGPLFLFRFGWELGDAFAPAGS